MSNKNKFYIEESFEFGLIKKYRFSINNYHIRQLIMKKYL